MAQRVHIVLEDDLDGTPASETVTFSLDGNAYEVDLSEVNAQALRDALAPWVAVARKASTPRRTSTRRPARSGSSKASATEIRAWAKDQGLEVSERGRVRDEVKAAYEAAHA